MAGNYEIELLREEKDCYLLKIVSSKGLANFIITLWVSKMSWLPVRIKVETTEMVFNSDILDVKLNTKIKDKLFKFKIPKGVSVF